MLGDGCLIQHKQGHRYITITVKEDDESILRQFCEWLHLDPTHIKHGTNNYGTKYSRLDAYGNFFKNDFSQFGLVPKKTYNPVIPNIPDGYFRPFLLGLIDADGSVAWRKATTNNKFPDRKQQYEQYIQLVGHPLIMDWTKQQLNDIEYSCNINEQIVKGKWKRIRIQRKEDILQLASCLQLDQYYHLCLSRKWESLHEAITQ